MAYEMVHRGKFKGALPTVSVVANTFRSGGIDIMLAGMRDQLYDKDRFEVILVDHRYEQRHTEVKALANAYGIRNFTHVPEYQRNGKWVSFCSAWNTGFMLAQGEITLTLCDYSYAPPSWIEKHVAWHYDTTGRKLKRLAIGPHSYHTMPLPFLFRGSEDEYKTWIANQKEIRGCCFEQPDFGERFGEISIFPNLFDPIEVKRTFLCQPPHQDPKLLYETGRCLREWMHVKNESCFTESIYEINGLDELFEYGKGPMDNEFGARFEYSGHELVFDRDNVIFCFDPRFLMTTMPWGNMEKSIEGRWSYYQGESYQNLRYNEFAAGAKPWAPNPYSLRDKRQQLLRWKMLKEITPDMIEAKPPCTYYPPTGVKAGENRNIPIPVNNPSEINADSINHWERCLYGNPADWDRGTDRGKAPCDGYKSGDFISTSPEFLRDRLTSFWVERNKVGCGLDQKPGDEFYQELNAMDLNGELKGRRVLDFGSGSGVDSLHMTQCGAVVTACDIVPNNVRLVEKVLDFEGSLSKAVLLESYDDIAKLGMFDMVFSNGCLHHIQSDKISYVIAQLKKVLKPGGIFLCMMYTDVYYPYDNANKEGPFATGYSIEQLKALLGMKLESYRIFNQRTYMWGVFRNGY